MTKSQNPLIVSRGYRPGRCLDLHRIQGASFGLGVVVLLVNEVVLGWIKSQKKNGRDSTGATLAVR